MRVVLFLVFTVFCIAGCRDGKETEKRTVGNGGALMADYRVSADADKDVVTVVLRFQADEDSEPLALTGPARVEFDGEELAPDSASRGGAFYEAVRPAAEFAGGHRIRYTDNAGRTHEEGFRFEPFSLAENLPERLPKKPFSIRFTGFPQQRTTVQLVLTDTSFASPDVNEDVQVEKGELRITAKHLAALEKGPVTLEIYHDDETPVRPSGKLVLSYGLRRHFELTD